MRGIGAVAAATTLLLAGCADSGSGEEPGTPPPPPSVTEPTDEPTDVPATTPPPAQQPPTQPPTTPPPTVQPPTQPPNVNELVGVPEPGVEAGCWLIDGYLLLGGDEELFSSGQPVRVTGAVVRDVMTTCQQGIPYRVDSVEPAQ